ncbi:hypothetical protein ACJ2A9_14570 [Anaerobacillus sp. MEB173]|uniref:hypothetical protein n=1 Tax=Anaerobacillus sp. MEB173 TaxID=3383345 RepID=UPI003F92EC8B
MKKWLISFILCGLTLVACSNDKLVGEEDVLVSYYELVDMCNELFRYHAPMDEHYINEAYQHVADVQNLLEGKVTEHGLEQIIESIFDKEEEQLVYKGQYKRYIEESYYYGNDYNHRDEYYPTVRESILNPGLQIISSEELQVESKDENVLVTGEQVPVIFYDEEDRLNKMQFQRFGYPAVDYITISFSFVHKNGQYLMDDYHIEIVEG